MALTNCYQSRFRGSDTQNGKWTLLLWDNRARSSGGRTFPRAKSGELPLEDLRKRGKKKSRNRKNEKSSSLLQMSPNIQFVLTAFTCFSFSFFYIDTNLIVILQLYYRQVCWFFLTVSTLLGFFANCFFVTSVVSLCACMATWTSNLPRCRSYCL